MHQVRFHGRGGQGVVTAAELLSTAAFATGRWAQAIPSFGSERTGAPVVAFCRIADFPVRTREPVVAPDVLVVQDATLLHGLGVLAGLVPGGTLLVNSRRTPEELDLRGLVEREAGPDHMRLVTVPATDLALEHTGRAVPNAVMLGALAGATGIVPLDSVLTAIRQRLHGAAGEGNAAAAEAAYDAALERAGGRRAAAG
ncbi:MAG: 2-oxoacid:acceptor oxidoreductase family protein [Motilibacteraceae bacterium]